MLKTKLTALILSLAIIFTLASCKAVQQQVEQGNPNAGADTQFNSNEAVDVTTTKTKSQEVTTAVKKPSELSKKLAQLIGNAGKENKLHLGMTNAEIKKLLTEEKIPFELSKSDSEYVREETSELFLFADGAMICYDFYSVVQTQEGLKIGDSIETVGKLYGKPYYDGGGYYQYLTGGVDSMFDMKIKLSINFTGGSVSAMEYRTLQDYEEEAQKN